MSWGLFCVKETQMFLLLVTFPTPDWKIPQRFNFHTADIISLLLIVLLLISPGDSLIFILMELNEFKSSLNLILTTVRPRLGIEIEKPGAAHTHLHLQTQMFFLHFLSLKNPTVFVLFSFTMMRKREIQTLSENDTTRIQTEWGFLFLLHLN